MRDEKNIKDYLHLYGFGSEVLTVDGLGETLRMYPRGITVSLKNIFLNQELHGFDEGNGGLHRTYLFEDNNIKLVLRPLSDMTDEENVVWLQVKGDDYGKTIKSYAESTKFLLSKHFDLFSLIESGLAIDKNTLTT